MKLKLGFVLLFYFVSMVQCTILRNLLLRRSRDANDDESGIHHSVLDTFSSLAGDFGLKNLFREAQIKVLSATESLLDQSSEIYNDFQEAIASARGSHDQKSSDVKKTLRYLKTEARRLREDIEDEIEIEKEKVQELEAAEQKESKKKIKKLNDALKKLDEVTKKKVNSVKLNVEKRSEDLQSKIKKRSEELYAKVEKQSKNLNSKIDKLIHTKKTKSETEDKSNKEKSQFADKNVELTTLIPSVMSLGDGFGRHL